MQKLKYFIILTLLTGCYYDKFNELYPLNGASNVCASTTAATYTASIKIILSTNCTSCHNDAVSNGGINLNSYVNAKTEGANGRLLGTITHASGYVAMPPGTSIRACEIEKIQAWIQNDMPE